jgi:transposase
MWFAGIDWADQHHDVVVLDEHGQQVASLHVAHTAEGVGRLTTFLCQLSSPGPAQAEAQGQGEAGAEPHLDQLACLVETTHGLLITALLEAGLCVCPVNPKTVDRLRPPSGVKTDQLDALLLARKGRSDWPHVRVLRPDSPLIQELKTLTRDLEGLVREQTRLVNQMTACLKAYYPAALTCFDGLTRQVTLAFLRAFPSPEVGASAGEEAVESVLRAAHYPHPERKAAALCALLRSPRLQAAPAVSRAKTRLLLALLAQLQALVEHIAAYDRAIAEVFAQHADSAVFASLPGAGRRLAPRLLAEWGDDRERYESAAAVQALAGTAPVVVQSGQSRRVRRRRACVNAFRQALYHFARESVLGEEWARASYTRRRQRGHSAAMALRGVAQQWVRILYALWVKREAYDATVFVAAQQAHARERALAVAVAVAVAV